MRAFEFEPSGSSTANALILVAGLALSVGCIDLNGEQGEEETCLVNADCGAGYDCEDGVCVPAGEGPECFGHDDCHDGYICVEGGCHPEPAERCTADADCEAHEQCHTASGVCIPRSGVPPGSGDGGEDPCDPNPCRGMPHSNEICLADGQEYSCGCLPGYVWYDSECTSSTREVDCANSKPENASWKPAYEDGRLTQSWDGEEFSPPADSCEWECDPGYHTEDEETCISSTRHSVDCTGLPEYASWNTTDNITQTWNGEEWEPPAKGVHDENPSVDECRFVCNSYFAWDEEACVFCDTNEQCGSDCSPCPDTATQCRDRGFDTSECVECYSDNHCLSPTPFCQNEVCIECFNDSHCPDGKICSLANTCIDNPCLPNPCYYEAPVVRLDIEEGSGSSLGDTSGHDNNGTVFGATWFSEGKYGHALEFDGQNDYLSWSYSAPQNNFTLEAWVRTAESHDIDNESTSGTHGTSGGRYVFWPDNGGSSSAVAGFSVGVNGVSVYEHGDSYMPALAVYERDIGSGWNHVVVTYNNKRPRIYLNGSLVHTGLTSPRSSVKAPNRVGGGAYGSFSGLIDRVKVYDYTLSDEEVFQAFAKSEVCFPGYSEEEFTCECDHGWDWDEADSTCIPKVFQCSTKPLEGAQWNTVSEFIQRWDSELGMWVPPASATHYNEEPDEESCRFICEHGYRYDGQTCEPRPVCMTGSHFSSVTALDLLHAMDICDFYDENEEGSFGIVPGSARVGRANWPSDGNTPNFRQYGIMTQFGTNSSNLPRFGDNMAVLSSGRARDASDPDATGRVSYEYEFGEPPNDFVAPHGGDLPLTHPNCPEGEGANDSVMLRVKLKVPEFAHAFSFDFRFFSQEYRKWTCTKFNDFFIAMQDSEWTPENGGSGIPDDKNISFDSNDNYISVNSQQFFTVCQPKTGYTCPDGTSALSGTGYTASEAGATVWLTTTSPVVPGETITLRFIIWDTSDRKYDSLVLHDNFRRHAEGAARDGPGTHPGGDTSAGN